MSKTILIVDDEKAFVQLIEKSLTQRGYRVIAAFNGEEALKRIQTTPPDLVLLDIHMPKMSGLAVYNKIFLHSPGQKPLCPVIIVTGNNAMEDMFEKTMIDGFILKPVSIEKLREKIDDIFTHQKNVLAESRVIASKNLKKVLIIEDNETILQKLSILLLNEGYLVSISQSGTDALKKITSKDLPHLVLIRNNMEGSPLQQISAYLRASTTGRDVSMVIYAQDLKKLTLSEEVALANCAGNKNLADLNDLNHLVARCKAILDASGDHHPIAA